MVSRGNGEEISRRQQSIKGGGGGEYRRLTANEGGSLEYYRASSGAQVNFIVTQPNPILPLPLPDDK